MARVAFVVDEMFEDSEFRVPYDRLRTAGHEVAIIGREAGKQLQGKKGKETIKTERSISEVSAEAFDALVCTSKAVADMVRAVTGAYAEHLRERHGGSPGTRVSVDGVVRGECPQRLVLSEGGHDVRFIFDPTGESRGERFTLKASDLLTIQADFTGATPTVKFQR